MYNIDVRNISALFVGNPIKNISSLKNRPCPLTFFLFIKFMLIFYESVYVNQENNGLFFRKKMNLNMKNHQICIYHRILFLSLVVFYYNVQLFFFFKYSFSYKLHIQRVQQWHARGCNMADFFIFSPGLGCNSIYLYGIYILQIQVLS